MKRILIFAVLVISASLARAQDIAGDWQGTLSVSGAELRLVLHITQVPDHTLKATLDSIDQPGANGIPVNSITLRDSKLNLDVEIVHGTYEGKVAADLSTKDLTVEEVVRYIVTDPDADRPLADQSRANTRPTAER